MGEVNLQMASLEADRKQGVPVSFPVHGARQGPSDPSLPNALGHTQLPLRPDLLGSTQSRLVAIHKGNISG